MDIRRAYLIGLRMAKGLSYFMGEIFTDLCDVA